ncbi:hypothetical protein F7U66_18690 [Vibrio parahaemolyticus]|nr:hypothetical protein [Vibrio parahaemolyticus]
MFTLNSNDTLKALSKNLSVTLHKREKVDIKKERLAAYIAASLPGMPEGYNINTLRSDFKKAQSTKQENNAAELAQEASFDFLGRNKEIIVKYVKSTLIGAVTENMIELLRAHLALSLESYIDTGLTEHATITSQLNSDEFYSYCNEVERKNHILRAYGESFSDFHLRVGKAALIEYTIDVVIEGFNTLHRDLVNDPVADSNYPTNKLRNFNFEPSGELETEALNEFTIELIKEHFTINCIFESFTI